MGRREPRAHRGRAGSGRAASASLLATSHVSASRRNESKVAQEQIVEEIFLKANLKKIPTRSIATLSQAPQPGELCRESMLGKRKADFVLRLWDHRVMAIECKVSNSAVNSVKRVSNDAAAKAKAWLDDFGTQQMVPVAVLSRAYKLHNLVDAKLRGLTLFWAHDLGTLISCVERMGMGNGAPGFQYTISAAKQSVRCFALAGAPEARPAFAFGGMEDGVTLLL